MSPGLQQKFVYMGANAGSFEKAHREVAMTMNLLVDPKQIERLTERIGEARRIERD